jgi:small subunit ribosomal protein S1
MTPAPEGSADAANAAARAPRGPVTPKLAIGQVVTGKVVRIESYGLFVQLNETEDRFGRGLIPAGELGVPRGVDLRKTFPEGTELTAVVLETGAGKLKLSVKGAKDATERAEFETHRVKGGAAKGFGTLADLLGKVAVKK